MDSLSGAEKALRGFEGLTRVRTEGDAFGCAASRGASLLLGVKPEWRALTLLGFLAGVSAITHDFCNSEDPEERMQNLNFLKNTALAGGALALMAIDEPWQASIPVGSRVLPTERATQAGGPPP